MAEDGEGRVQEAHITLNVFFLGPQELLELQVSCGLFDAHRRTKTKKTRVMGEIGESLHEGAGEEDAEPTVQA